MTPGTLWQRLPRSLAFTRLQLAQGLRGTVSAALALVVALLLDLPMPVWSVLSAVTVNQLSLGRSLKTSMSYVLGTFAGSVYGGGIGLLIPHASEATLLLVLVLAVAPLALYAASHANMNVVPVSAVIVLLMPTFSHRDPLHSVIDRVLEVTIGALVGMLVALFVMPSSAHRQTREAAARMLGEMAQTLTVLMHGVLDGLTVEAINRVQDRIGGTLRELDTLGGEAEQERSARLTTGVDTGPLRRTLLRLRHDLIIIGRAVGMPVSESMRARLRPLLGEVGATGSHYMGACGTALLEGKGPPPLDMFQRALDGYEAEVQAIRAEGLTMPLSVEAAEGFFAVSFALEQMRHHLDDLERLVGEWRTPDGARRVR